MNRWEKEVLASWLKDEKTALKAVEGHYTAALAEIKKKIILMEGQDGEMAQSQIYQLQYQKSLQAQINAILKKLHSDEYQTIQAFLEGCYTSGFLGTMYSVAGQGIPLLLPMDPAAVVRAVITDSKLSEDLYESLGVDINNLKRVIRSEISRGIAANLPIDEITRNISMRTGTPLAHAKTIARTESHRIQEAATEDARQAVKKRGCNVIKQWDSTLDGDTRPTHQRLDGQIVETDEPFEMDGKKAMFPGDFGDPAEDCNCRCHALTRAKAAMTERELETLRERAAFFGIDKTDGFEDFKQKYLKSVNTPIEFTEGNDANIYFGQKPSMALRRSNRDEYDRQRETYRSSMYGSWYDGLSDIEISSIGAYSGDDYAGINGLLRGQMTEKMVARWNVGSQYTLQDKIASITDAIGKFDLREPIRVYRTCEEDVFESLKRQIGSIFVDDGFTSTSILSAKVASGNVRMIIDVPAGKGIGAWINPLSGSADEEWEFLLQRGTKFRIDGIDTVDGETCIRMTVIGNDMKDWRFASREEVEALWKRRGMWDKDSESQI